MVGGWSFPEEEVQGGRSLEIPFVVAALPVLHGAVQYVVEALVMTATGVGGALAMIGGRAGPSLQRGTGIVPWTAQGQGRVLHYDHRTPVAQHPRMRGGQ